VTRLIRARIDGAALQSNLKLIRTRAPRSRVMAVVKANAYGHGLMPTALALIDADAFGVARLGEAIMLREAGLTHRIVLLEGVFDAAQLAEAARYQLDLVIHQPLQIELLEAFRGSQRWSLWLKVDTGMNRLGFRPEEFHAAWQRLGALHPAPGQLRVLTHLACSEELDNSVTAQQLAAIHALVEGLEVELSIANSAAILSRPDSHADWVRPGLALYGISPFAAQAGSAHSGADLGLRAAMTLESNVIALRDVRAGERVGYGGMWQAQRRSRLAIVAAGYGDGLPRSLPSGTPVLIGGRRASLAGRVSMDMIAVDVTDLPPVVVGERVELWGPQLAVEELSAAAGTIPHELLCGVSQRVPIELV
jgi:alanine racemase